MSRGELIKLISALMTHLRFEKSDGSGGGGGAPAPTSAPAPAPAPAPASHAIRNEIATSIAEKLLEYVGQLKKKEQSQTPSGHRTSVYTYGNIIQARLISTRFLTLLGESSLSLVKAHKNRVVEIFTSLEMDEKGGSEVIWDYLLIYGIVYSFNSIVSTKSKGSGTHKKDIDSQNFSKVLTSIRMRILNRQLLPCSALGCHHYVEVSGLPSEEMAKTFESNPDLDVKSIIGGVNAICRVCAKAPVGSVDGPSHCTVCESVLTKYNLPYYCIQTQITECCNCMEVMTPPK